MFYIGGGFGAVIALIAFLVYTNINNGFRCGL